MVDAVNDYDVVTDRVYDVTEFLDGMSGEACIDVFGLAFPRPSRRKQDYLEVCWEGCYVCPLQHLFGCIIHLLLAEKNMTPYTLRMLLPHTFRYRSSMPLKSHIV